MRYILATLLVFAFSFQTFANEKDDKIRQLENENLKLKKENAELKRKFGNDLEQIANDIETRDDRENEAIRKLQRNGLIKSMRPDGTALQIKVNQDKWDALDQEQKNKLVHALALWYDKYLLPHTRDHKTINIESEFGRVGFYDEGEIQFIK